MGYEIAEILTNVERIRASLAIKRAAPERKATLDKNICAIIAITAMPEKIFRFILGKFSC